MVNYKQVVYSLMENTLPIKSPAGLDVGIKFMGLINKHGRLENSVKDKNFVLLDKISEMLFMSIRLQNSLQNDFTEQFGKVSQIFIEHEKLDFFLFPLGTFVIVVIAEKDLSRSKVKTAVLSNLNFLHSVTQIKENQCQ